MKDGCVASPLVRLNFCGPPVAHDGFKAMLRENAFDAGQLAMITTCLQSTGTLRESAPRW
jgi:4,5-dihydroxyphthalate decarboxylase